MARIRSVHPDICTDETLAEVSASAERTFVRLWTHLDDEGRARDNPKLIKAALYPLHDDMTADEVDADLNELARHGLVWRYEVDGVRLIAAKPASWGDRQKPRHPSPSKLGAPPEDYRPPSGDPPPHGGGSREDSGNTRSDRRRPTADRRNGSANGREPTALVGDGVGEGEGGVRGGSEPPDLRLVVDEPAPSPPAPAPSFDDFYEAYPRKVARGQAEKAWAAAIKRDDPATIIEGARRLAADPNLPTGSERSFIKHPGTWLRAKGWLDEPLPPRQGGQRRASGQDVAAPNTNSKWG